MTPPLPRRPRWRSLALLALCLAPLLWPLEHLAERYYRSELAGQNRQTLDLYVANLLAHLGTHLLVLEIINETVIRAIPPTGPMVEHHSWLQRIDRHNTTFIRVIVSVDRIQRVPQPECSSATHGKSAYSDFDVSISTS